MFWKHVTKDTSAYCHGELSARESRRFAEHIIACAKCRSDFEHIKLGIRLAEQLPMLSAPGHLWSGIERLLEEEGAGRPILTARKPLSRSWQLRIGIAVGLVAVLSLGAYLLHLRHERTQANGPSWQVERLNGRPTIGSDRINDKGQLAVGQWLETDADSRAQIAVSSIGQVEIDPNTRVRLIESQPLEHRLELARGKMSARIWAPPRLFFVDTPSAVAADLGCAYTLEVNDAGGSLLHVTAGWVALQLNDRESMVPAGAACETRRGVGPGTPYFEDASDVFRQALEKLDFGAKSEQAPELSLLLDRARSRDTLTLWHLLSRVEGDDRQRVYEKIATFVPPPADVTREGVFLLDQQMLNRWRDLLEPSWSQNTVVPKKVAEMWWRLRNGVNRRVKKLGSEPLSKVDIN
jgi:FecR protein/Putative zinc-finger